MTDDDEDKVLRELVTNNVEDGDFEVRKIQKLGRVDVPNDYWEHMGLDIGEDVIVKVQSDRITIMEKDLSNIQ